MVNVYNLVVDILNYVFKSIISFFNTFKQYLCPNDLSTWTLIKKAEQTEIYV